MCSHLTVFFSGDMSLKVVDSILLSIGKFSNQKVIQDEKKIFTWMI